MTQPSHIPSQVTIATRESALALWQAHFVRDALLALYPQLSVQILGMTTTGDRRLEVTLSKIGGKGLFVKELEQAMLEGRADFAVHSMKDVPVDMPPEFEIAAILAREEASDAFVSNRYESLAALPEGARVGTSSLRRQSQIQHRYPHLVILPLRGNVQTRLRKLDEGEYDAIILASAGLKRLGLGTRIRCSLDTIPAVGQGALGIEMLRGNDLIRSLLAPLVCPQTRDCVLAERAMSETLGGSCTTPIGAHAVVDAATDTLMVHGFVASEDGRRMLVAEVAGPRGAAETLGRDLAARLLAAGAGALLATGG